MHKKILYMMISILVIASMGLVGCQPQVVEVTKEVQVEVTRVVEGEVQTVVITATPEAPKGVELPKSIVIGVLEPLTGQDAVFGEEAKIGVELAIKHINESGGIKSLGGIPLEMVVEDAGSDADSARLGAESIISKHHPLAIMGLYISRMTMAASEVTDREKVILMADALVPAITQMGRQYVFRPGPDASVHGASAVKFVMEAAKEKGITVDTIAMVNEDSAFGRAVILGANNEAINQGLTIVYQKEYPWDITDATTIVNEIAKSGADFLVHCPYFNDAIVYAKAFAETGKTPPYVAGAGACGYSDPGSIKAMGNLSEGFSNTYSYNPAKKTPQNEKFVSEFKQKMGYIPTEGAGMNYYDVWVLKEGLEKAGEMFPDDPLNPDHIRAALLALDLTSGPAVESYPSDHIQFDGKGDNKYSKAVILQVQNGEPKVVWPFEDAEAEFIFPLPGKTIK